MILDRRELLRDIALCGGAACLPGPVFGAAADKVRRFGLINISTNGLTVVVYELSRQMLADADHLSGYERLAPIHAGDVPTPIRMPLEPGADAMTVAPTIDIIVSQVDVLLAMGVRRSDISVIVSSGLETFAGPLIPKMRDMLHARSNILLTYLGARDQARLQFDWVVPKQQRGQVFQLEIGGGNTRGGYYDRPGRHGRYFDLSVPFGTKTMTAAVKARWPEVGTFDFPARAAQFYADTVAGTFAPQAEAMSGALKLPELFLTGNIVRAAAVILYPREMAAERDWLDLAPDDFAKIGKFVEAGTPYGVVPDGLTDSERASLLKTRSAIRRIFNPHQIAAGAALVDGLSRQLAFAGRKKLRFPVLASNGWGSQYLIEQVESGGQKQAG